MEEQKNADGVMAHMRKQLDELHAALVGNSITKDGGLVERMRLLEARQDEQEALIAKLEKALTKVAIYMKLVWASAGSVATAIFSLIIKK